MLHRAAAGLYLAAMEYVGDARAIMDEWGLDDGFDCYAVGAANVNKKLAQDLAGCMAEDLGRRVEVSPRRVTLFSTNCAMWAARSAMALGISAMKLLKLAGRLAGDMDLPSLLTDRATQLLNELASWEQQQGSHNGGSGQGGAGRGSGSGRGRQGRVPGACFNCGGLGHYARDCPS